jgi:hypothetical protein
MDFDPNVIAVGGVSLIVLVFGLLEFIKEAFNLSGKIVTVIAACLGVVVMVAYRLIGIVPEPYSQVVDIVFASLAFGLAASGYYKFINKRAPANKG